MTVINKINMKTLTSISVLFVVFFANAQTFNPEDTEEVIIGTWVSEEDNNWTIEFTQTGLYYDHYQGEYSDTYNYEIVNISPLCGYDVPVADNTQYLILSKPLEGTDKLCYTINGFHRSSPERLTLSLTFVGNGGYLLFIKQ